MSDRGINETAARMMGDERYSALQGKAVSVLIQDLSAAYACFDSMNLPLAFGGRVVVQPMLNLADSMSASLFYGANVIFGIPFMIELMMEAPIVPDLSDVELIFIGGSYTSADSKKKFNKYLRKCGFKKGLTVGYGLTEAGGACIVAPEDREDDAIGYPFSGIKIKLYDEDEKKFYDYGSGPRTGVMYMSSPAISCGRIDDTVFFELEEIDGEQYLNTFDLVREGEDGAIYYEGRMNKYFVNNEGVRFDAGLVEKAVSSQEDIENCGLVPGYGRFLRDTVPILYVKTRKPAKDSEEIVRNALIQAFINENVIKETNLPSECIITDEIPYSSSGKIDTHQIATEDVDGYRYFVFPVRENGVLRDIELDEYDGSGWRRAGLPEELDKNQE
jgi:acyl-coenzyme A synthetase/AMP-(fatty) acid ligase